VLPKQPAMAIIPATPAKHVTIVSTVLPEVRVGFVLQVLKRRKQKSNLLPLPNARLPPRKEADVNDPGVQAVIVGSTHKLLRILVRGLKQLTSQSLYCLYLI